MEGSWGSGHDAKKGFADTSRLLSIFDDAFERVMSDYVDEVSGDSLIENAINGMLAKRHPYSAYMGAQALRDLNDDIAGKSVALVWTPIRMLTTRG